MLNTLTMMKNDVRAVCSETLTRELSVTDERSTMVTQNIIGKGSMLNHVFRSSCSGEWSTFPKLSVKDLVEGDVEHIRSVQEEREVNSPFEGDDFMEILINGGNKLNTLRQRMEDAKNESLED